MKKLLMRELFWDDKEYSGLFYLVLVTLSKILDGSLFWLVFMYAGHFILFYQNKKLFERKSSVFLQLPMDAEEKLASLVKRNLVLNSIVMLAIMIIAGSLSFFGKPLLSIPGYFNYSYVSLFLSRIACDAVLPLFCIIAVKTALPKINSWIPFMILELSIHSICLWLNLNVSIYVSLGVNLLLAAVLGYCTLAILKYEYNGGSYAK